MILSALLVSALVDRQSRNAPIPTIDWNNLPYQNQVKQMADGWREKYHLPGVWCAYIKGGKVVACVAAGFRNLETQEPARLSDHLSIGSVCKPISAALVAIHISRGEISYETKLGETFPEEARQNPSNPLFHATLRQYLTHSSGMPTHFSYPWGVMTSRKEALKRVFAMTGTPEPGSRYQYSNENYLVATEMVEKASNSTLEQWITGSDGKAVGLSDVQIVGSPTAEVKAYTLGDDDVIGRTKEVTVPHIAFHPAGTYCIDLESACRFALGTMNGFPGMKREIYDQVIHFPNNLPTAGVDAEQRVSTVQKHTSGGWGGNDQLYLIHNGNAHHGYCELYVSVRMKRAFFLYTNLNGNKNEDPIPGYKQVREDIRQLRYER